MEQEIISKLDQLELLIDSTQVQPEHTELFCEIVDVYTVHLQGVDNTPTAKPQLSMEQAAAQQHFEEN